MLKPSNFVQKGLLRYKVGDATIPVSGGMRYILQVNNPAERKAKYTRLLTQFQEAILFQIHKALLSRPYRLIHNF